MTGAGDIAPAVREPADWRRHRDILVGTFAALIAVIVLGTLFITTEYRRGMIRSTWPPAPGGAGCCGQGNRDGRRHLRRGLVGAAIAVPLGERLARANGKYLFPVNPRPSCE